MRSNPIGHTIFLTSEEHRMTNQKTDTIFFTSEKIRIGFSRLSGRPCEQSVSMSLARKLSGSFAPLFSQRRLQQDLLMLALSKILFFNTRINQLFKKQNEMSSFYSHLWKKKSRKTSGKHSG